MSIATIPQRPAPTITAEDERLVANLIVKGASRDQLALVLGVCRRYNLDPLLRHVAIVANNLYITRDGLLRIAHSHPQFDGLQVTRCVRDAEGHWEATVAVYRKDFSRPIEMSAYQPEHENPQSSAWKKAPRAMTIKCAVVMALRHAFDVSLGAAEEIGWDGQSEHTNIGEARFVVNETPTGPAHPTRPAAITPQSSSPNPGSAAAPPGAAASPHAGEELTWTAFWSWARARGYSDRGALNRAAGVDTGGTSPAEIKALLEAKEREGTVGVQEPQPARAERAPRTIEAATAAIADAKLSDERRWKAAEWAFGQVDGPGDAAGIYQAVAQSLGPEAAHTLWQQRAAELGVAAVEDEPPDDADGEVIEGEVVAEGEA